MKKHKLNHYFTEQELNELRELVKIKHEHYDGQNECAICDGSLIRAAINEIKGLKAQIAEMKIIASYLK